MIFVLKSFGPVTLVRPTRSCFTLSGRPGDMHQTGQPTPRVAS